MAVWFPWHTQGRRSESAAQNLNVDPGHDISILGLSDGIVGLATHNQSLLKHKEESNTHTDTDSNWAAIKAPRHIDAVADWLRFHRTCQKPECKLIAKSKATLFPRLMAFSWETLWMDWAKISMMHDESCLLVSSMQWRSRLNPKFQAPCNFIRGFWSFDLGVAVTQSCFMCFSPQNSSLYWPQNDQIRRETATKLFF